MTTNKSKKDFLLKALREVQAKHPLDGQIIWLTSIDLALDLMKLGYTPEKDYQDIVNTVEECAKLDKTPSKLL